MLYGNVILPAKNKKFLVLHVKYPIFLSDFSQILDFSADLSQKYATLRGPGSSVGIGTDYGLDGLGIESRRGRDFPPFQTGPENHPASCTMGTGSFRG